MDINKTLEKLFFDLHQFSISDDSLKMELTIARNLFFRIGNKNSSIPAPFAATINVKNGLDKAMIIYNPKMLGELVEERNASEDDLAKFLVGAIIHEVRHIVRGDLWNSLGNVSQVESTILNLLQDAAIHATNPDITKFLTTLMVSPDGKEGIITPNNVVDSLALIFMTLYRFNPRNEVEEFVKKWTEDMSKSLDPKIWNLQRYPYIPRMILYPDEFIIELRKFKFPGKGGSGQKKRKGSGQGQGQQGQGKGKSQSQNGSGSGQDQGQGKGKSQSQNNNGGGRNNQDNQDNQDNNNDGDRELPDDIKDWIKEMNKKMPGNIDYQDISEKNDGRGPSKASQQRAQGQIQSAVQEAMTELGKKSRGFLPGLFEEFLKKLYEPRKVPKLKGAKDAHNAIKRKYRFVKRPDKKLGIPPVSVKKEGQYLVVIVDTSGSMSTEELELAAGFVEKYRKSGFGILLVEIDVIVNDVKWIRYPKWWKKISFKGRGGTALEILDEPLPDKFKKFESKFRNAPWVIITDGGTGYPSEQPNNPRYPVVVIMTDKNGARPKFKHKVVYVDIPREN